MKDLQDLLQEEVVALLTDSESAVKIALLKEMPRLCIFFGKQKANDLLISHIITYLNDLDWKLRSAFCEAIVGVGTFAGTLTLEQFILPLLVMAITDGEELVVQRVLHSLTSLAELGLIQKHKLKDLSSQISPLLIHPNNLIKNAAIGYIAAISKILPLLDVRSILYTIVKPFIMKEPFILTEACLMDNLKPPVLSEDLSLVASCILRSCCRIFATKRHIWQEE